MLKNKALSFQEVIDIYFPSFVDGCFISFVLLSDALLCSRFEKKRKDAEVKHFLNLTPKNIIN